MNDNDEFIMLHREQVAFKRSSEQTRWRQWPYPFSINEDKPDRAPQVEKAAPVIMEDLTALGL